MNELSHSFHQQRSVGKIALSVTSTGLKRLREEGSAKVRFPHMGREAILINTGGGLAGGDDFTFEIEVGAEAGLTVTTQAAERVYRTLGPSAHVHTQLRVADGATLYWLPQESILFDGSNLSRRLDVELAANSRFIAVEPVLFGRPESAEVISHIAFRDCWRVKQNGKLIFADDLHLNGPVPLSKATLNGAGAMATLLCISLDAEKHLEALRATIGSGGAASFWNGKLVARLVAKDGFTLRKSLIPALAVLAGRDNLPKVWTF